MWRCVKICLVVIAVIAAIATSSYSDSALSEKRDQAIKGIEVCLKRNEASSRECKNMNTDIQTLMDVYRQGDKTVLPMLVRFVYLNDFFGEALLGDTNGFLSTLSRLPKLNQQAVAMGLAGGPFGLKPPRFQAIRSTLMAVQDSSPNYQAARICLRILEMENAALVENYFPPNTFTGRAGDLTLHSLSRNLHLLEEKPLWPPASEKEQTYRVTVLPCFSVPESATLTMAADQSGRIEYRSAESRSQHSSVDKTRTVSSEQVTEFVSLLNQIQFWQMPTESRQLGLDGADWIIEGVQDGKYHVVLRWCPGKTPFGEAARGLLKLAGHKSSGSC